MLSSQLTAPGQLEMRDVPVPQAGPGEVVIRVETALTCGTDLKTYRRGHPKFPFPFLMGHEYTGVVHQAGPGVSAFRAGDAVMGVHSAPCNKCRMCRRGYQNLCESIIARMAWGAFAQYYKAPAEVVAQNLYLRPSHVSPQRAAFLEPLACVVQGQAQIPLDPEDTVVVMGCGTIGLLHVMLAKQRGAGRIIVSGRHQERLLLAQELGATDLIDVDRSDARAEVQRLTGGRGAELVIECVGRPDAWQEAHWHAAQAGFVLLFGGCPANSSAAFDTTRLHYDQLTLKGVFHFTPSDVKQAYHYLCDTPLPVEKILSGSATLDKLPEIIARLDRGQGIKYAIQP
ncbi:MAG: alcohol dehydrogenase catalytic domain-containing protein [Vulcanimicrobiota bacterium]